MAVINFTEAFSKLSPQEFIDQVLLPNFEPQIVIVGENFTFGAKAAGDVKFLAENSPFKVKAMPLQTQGDITVSSTRIREAIRAGNIEIANQLLTRPHASLGVAIPLAHG